MDLSEIIPAKYISQVENMYQKKVYIPGTDSIVKMINIADRVVLIGIPLLLFIIIISKHKGNNVSDYCSCALFTFSRHIITS